ncbi:MAG: response regulator [Magnetococcales bacterium]|nr:response regulator [Magnetococcales bacterium]
MGDKKLQERIDFLEMVNRQHQFALDLAADMVQLHGKTSYTRDPVIVLQEANKFIGRLFVNFTASAFTIVDEEDSTFKLALCDPESKTKAMDDLLMELIFSSEFAWALNQNRAVVVADKWQGHSVVMHLLSTHHRVRGMFIGILDKINPTLSSANMNLLSIIFRNTAYALESAELYRMLDYNLEDRNQLLFNERKNALVNSQRHMESRDTITDLLHLSLKSMELNKIMEMALNLLLSVSWMPDKKNGAIFLKVWGEDRLQLITQEGFSKSTIDKCSTVVMGSCLCGKSAADMQFLFVANGDKKQNIACEKANRGHYVVPIIAEDKLLGVVKLSQAESHEQSPEEKTFLTTFATTLAGIIERSRVEKERAETELANKAKSDFLANMSHEIRTPMNAVIGLTELALGCNLEQKVRVYLNNINNASNSLLRIINDILDFSKIDAGKLEMEPVKFRICDIFDNLKNLFRYQASAAGIKFVLKPSKECQYLLLGDSLRIEQILINLVSNAIKFTNKGKVSVEVASVAGEEVDSPFINLKFLVRDSGIGMTKEEAAKLFQPFVQADGSTTRNYGGTGLGLTICKRLVNLMGGEIWLDSEPGEGSVFGFTIKLELLEKEKIEVQTSQFKEQIKGLPDLTGIMQQIGGSHILLVEDNSINQLVATEILEPVGLHIDIANNGVEALKMVKESSYDLVLMDIQMPLMDGHTAAKKIRAIKGLKKLPIIAMTAHARAIDREKSLAAGMNEHISKPIKQKTLFATLVRWLGKGGESTSNKNPVDTAHENPAALSQLATAKSRDIAKKLADDPIPEFMYDLPGLDLESALARLNYNHKLFRSILLEFQRNFASAPQEITKLLAGKRTGDRQEAQGIIHSVKGMAGNISANDLYTVAAALEIAIEEERVDDWPQLLQQFKVVLGQIVDISLREESTAIPPGPINRQAVAIIIKELTQLLLDTDSEAQESFDTLKPLLAGAEPPVIQELSRLEEYLDIFDFKHSQDSLNRVIELLGMSVDEVHS